MSAAAAAADTTPTVHAKAPQGARFRGTGTRFFYTIKSVKYGTYYTAPDFNIDTDPVTLSTTVGPRQLWLMITASNGNLRPTTPTMGRVKTSIDQTQLWPQLDPSEDGVPFILEPRIDANGVPTSYCLRVQIDIMVTPWTEKYVYANSSTAVTIQTACGNIFATPPDMGADWIIEPVPFALMNRGKFLSFPTSIGTSNLYTMSTDSSQKFTHSNAYDETSYLRSRDPNSTISTGFVGCDRSAAAGACVIASTMSAASMLWTQGYNAGKQMMIRFGPAYSYHPSTPEYKWLKVSATGVFSLENAYTEDDDYLFTLVWPS